MEEMLEVYCRNTDTKLLVRSGMDMLGVADFAGMKNTENILGVCVNNKVQNLNYRIYSPKTVEFLDINTTNGRRMYAFSLMFMLYRAVKELYPESELYIQHSMSDGYFCEINNLEESMPQVIGKLKERMCRMVEENIPFLRKIVPVAEAAELFERLGMKEKAELIRNSNRLYANVDLLGEVVNMFFFELVPSTAYLKVFDL